jgi:hypothetical protein
MIGALEMNTGALGGEIGVALEPGGEIHGLSAPGA